MLRSLGTTVCGNVDGIGGNTIMRPTSERCHLAGIARTSGSLSTSRLREAERPVQAQDARKPPPHGNCRCRASVVSRYCTLLHLRRDGPRNDVNEVDVQPLWDSPGEVRDYRRARRKPLGRSMSIGIRCACARLSQSRRPHAIGRYTVRVSMIYAGSPQCLAKPVPRADRGRPGISWWRSEPPPVLWSVSGEDCRCAQ